MQIRLTQVRDQLSPALRRHLKAAEDKRAVHEAMGTAIVSLAKRAFNQPALRPAPWPQRQGNAPHKLLQKSTTLRKSIRVMTLSRRRVVVGSDRKYAAIHQLGGKTAPHIIKPKNGKALFWPGAAHPVKQVKHPGSKIPARPFLPFTSQGQLTKVGRKRVEAAARAKLGIK